MFWFGKNKTQSREPVVASRVSVVTPAASVVHRDLVRMKLRKVLKAYGVPPHWVTCEVVPVEASAGILRFQLILTMTKWNAQLLRYTLTLQQKLLLSIEEYLPKSDRTEFRVSWTFAPSCNPPELEITNSASWVESEPASDGLSKLFDRRKAPRSPSRSSQLPGRGELKGHDNGDQEDEDFAKTSISPLR